MRLYKETEKFEQENAQIYYIKMDVSNDDTAGYKAIADVDFILGQQNGYREILFMSYNQTKRYGQVLKKIANYFVELSNWRNVVHTVPKGSILILQYPVCFTEKSSKILSLLQIARDYRTLYILHDINSLRQRKMKHKMASHEREKAIKMADVLICHNKRMKDYLEKQKVQSSIVCLDVFDYIHNIQIDSINRKKTDPIIYAGNLSKWKSIWIDKLFFADLHVHFNLYGPYFEERVDALNSSSVYSVSYKGSFNPDELPGVLEGSFGLVWDGDSFKTCSGSTGNYLKFNNPHKVSLYLASGIPVIIWREAAIAEYIVTNKLGFVIDSLYELKERIDLITDEEYEQMRKNALSEARKLRAGEHTIHAINQSLRLLATN